MSILGGNLIVKSPVHLQYKIVLLPWLQWNSTIKCLKDRQYSSSRPVKYIPKELRGTGKPESFSESESQTPNIQQRTRGIEEPKSSPWSDRTDYDKLSSSGSNLLRHEIMTNFSTENQKSLNLHLDEEPDLVEEMGYAMESIEPQFIEELEEVDDEIEVHNVSARGEFRLIEYKTKQDAGKMAVELLAARAFSAMELRRKLQAKRFQPTVIDDVLNDLQERGLLNDSLYAETYSRSRWSSSCWGPRRIKQALLRKGVNQADAENAVKEVFEDGEDGEKHMRHGISKSSMDQLYVQASKQWLRSQDAPRDTRKGRIIRWLQYRGFDWGVVSAILKKLESQNPS